MVLFNCMKEGKVAVEVMVTVGVGRMSYYFEKVCGGGVRSDLVVWAGDSLLVSEGTQINEFMPNAVRLGNQVTVALYCAKGVQYMSEPRIVGGSVVAIRGMGAFGGFIDNEFLTFMLIFDCVEEEEVRIEIEMAPFEQVKFGWVHECKQKPHEIQKAKISIGTNQFEGNIVREGTYLNATLSKIEENEHYSTFYVSSSEPTSISAPIITTD